MDYHILYNPVVTPAIAAVCACTVCAAITWRCRATLASMLDQARLRLFTRSSLFWTVNIVFMAVSVLHAGVFFGITGNGHDLPGMAQYLGFAVSFFLDLVTIILMQAMLESRYRGEEGRARQFLFFITVCCGTSTFANLAISLNDFDAAKMLPHAPMWVQTAAPYVLASFPLFVIMMSIAAEMIVNLRPLEKLQEEEYEADEKKRLRIMQIRNTYLEKQAIEEQRALSIRAQMKANKRAHKLSISWPFAKTETMDIDTAIADALEQLNTHYNEQIGALHEQLNALKNAHCILDEMPPQAILEGPSLAHFGASDEQENAPISLESRRQKCSPDEQDNEHYHEQVYEQTHEQRDTDKLAPSVSTKRALPGDSKLLKKVRRLVESNEQITAEALAQKIGKSRSHAGKLKKYVLDNPEPL